MKVCMAGACGRMGRRILDLVSQADDLEIGGAFELSHLAGTEIVTSTGEKVVVSEDEAAEIKRSDVLIDFTIADACVGNAQIAAELGKPVVIGATGITGEAREALAALTDRIPIVLAPNMSVGVNLLFKLTSEVARVLGPDFDVEIVEIHHNLKKDSPSGTAVRLGERAAEARGLDYGADTKHGRQGMVGERPQDEIGMHAVRGGDVTGDHTVYFLGNGERIELTHRAHSRETFAQGALRAARFAAAADPGLYDMQDVLGLK